MKQPWLIVHAENKAHIDVFKFFLLTKAKMFISYTA